MGENAKFTISCGAATEMHAIFCRSCRSLKNYDTFSHSYRHWYLHKLEMGRFRAFFVEHLILPKPDFGLKTV
jgi:hypothetical protein